MHAEYVGNQVWIRVEREGAGTNSTHFLFLTFVYDVAWKEWTSK